MAQRDAKAWVSTSPFAANHDLEMCPDMRSIDILEEEVKNMKKVRLYELAKELRLETRQVIADARRFGAMVSSPSSSVDEKVANRIRELYFPKKSAATEPRAARLVKAQKPAEEPAAAATAATAEEQTEGPAIQ